MEKVFNNACFTCLVILTVCLAAGAILHLLAGNYGWSATQTDTGRYTITEVAEAMGIHRNTVTRLIKRRVLKCNYRKYNNRPYILGADAKRVWRTTL